MTYRAAMLEEIANEAARFDIVSAMEVVEHVPDPARLVAEAASLLKPGGLFLASTLNRTLKSLAFAIVGAEYVLRWLEPGTHRWEQFVTPEEMTVAARKAGLRAIEKQGMTYDPLRRTWRLSSDLGVNYLVLGLEADRRLSAGAASSIPRSNVGLILGQDCERLTGEVGCQPPYFIFLSIAFSTEGETKNATSNFCRCTIGGPMGAGERAR